MQANAALYLKTAYLSVPCGCNTAPLEVVYQDSEFNIKSLSSYGLVTILVYAIFAYYINGDSAPVDWSKYEPIV